jgi:CheY-like chemotaxis protein
LLGLSDAAVLRPKPDERRVLRVSGPPGTIRVLIADDKLENCELLEQMLSNLGFATRAVGDGAEVLAAFADWQPQLILIDVRMPGLDGCEVIKRIRAQRGGEAVAIIAVTASVFDDDRRQVLAAGGNDFLGKPFREAMLLSKMKHLLGINFEYSVEPSGNSQQVSRLELTSERLAAELSPATRDALLTAARAADFDRLLAILDDVELTAPTIAAELRARVESFEYQGILDLLHIALIDR